MFLMLKKLIPINIFSYCNLTAKAGTPFRGLRGEEVLIITVEGHCQSCLKIN